MELYNEIIEFGGTPRWSWEKIDDVMALFDIFGWTDSRRYAILQRPKPRHDSR